MATDTQKPEENKPGPRAGEIGRTGTVNSDGWIQGTETNSDLRWPLSLTVFDNMRRTEIAIASMLKFVIAPLLSADCTVEPPSEDDLDVEVADFCSQVMRETEGGWDDFLRRLMTFLPMGFYVGEWAAEYRTITFGDNKTRDAFVITRIEDRLQRTITKWHNDDGRGPLTEIEQWLGDGIDDGSVSIPREKCVLIVCEQEGKDYFGNSILRAAYGAFTNKRKLELIEAIGIERSIGVVVAYPPQSADDSVLDAAEEQLQKLHQAESMYLVAPGPKQQAGQVNGEGWLFETLDVKGDGGSAKAHEAIQRYKTELAEVVLAGFMRLGHNDTGARATADAQSNPYIDAVKTVASQVAQVLRQDYLTPLVRWNYGEDVEVPTINFSGIEKIDTTSVMDAFQKAAAAGGITITAKDESHIRAMLGFPEIDEAEREQIKQEKIQEQQDAMKARGLAPGDQNPNQQDPKQNDPAAEKAHDHDHGHHFNGGYRDTFVPSRELRGNEVHVSWDAIDHGIDSHRAEFALAGAGPAERWAQQYITTGKGDTEELAAALESELVDTAEFGSDQVAKELARQKAATHQVFETHTPHLPPEAVAEIKRRARLAAESVVAAIAVAVQRAKIDFYRRPGEIHEGDLLDAGKEAARVALRDEALENTTATLNLGRDVEARRQGVTDATLSSVLDSGTCEPCAAADGTDVTVDSTEYQDLNPPLADCQGANRCRCIWVYNGQESV